MEVFIDKTNQRKQLSFEGTAKQLLRKLSINSEEVIIVKNDQITTLDAKVSDEDTIKILSVISGG